MSLPRPAYFVYLVGVLVFGFFYEQLKVLVGPGWRFFAASLLLLIVLRLIAESVERVLRTRATSDASSNDDA